MKPLKADKTDINVIGKKNFTTGDFVEIYKPKKKDGEVAAINDDPSWHQTISIPINKFPEMKNEKIAAKIMVVIIGPIMGIDENNYRIGVDSMAMVHGKTNKEFASSEKDYPIQAKAGKRNAAARYNLQKLSANGEELKKTLGGK